MTTPQGSEPAPEPTSAASPQAPQAPPVPVVPYAGTDAGPAKFAINLGQTPGVVTINGQDVHLDQGHPLRNLVALFRAGALNHTPGTVPVVTVNGQPLLGGAAAGTPVNVSTMFTPDQLARVQQGIAQLMTTHPEVAQHLGQVFQAPQ